MHDGRYPLFRPAGPQNGPKKGSCANLLERALILMFIRGSYSVKERKTRIAELSTLRRFLTPPLSPEPLLAGWGGMEFYKKFV